MNRFLPAIETFGIECAIYNYNADEKAIMINI
jgi:hypothetical protein